MTAVTTPNSPPAFPSLAAMRVAHQDLLKLAADWVMNTERRRHILGFLTNGARTGVVLQHRAERSAAQALLDYWVGVLYTAPAEPGQDPVPDIVLAPFDPESAPDLSDKRCPFIGLASFL